MSEGADRATRYLPSLGLAEDAVEKEFDMFSDTCEVEGKKGLLWLSREADFAVITNKKRHKLDEVNKFAVVQADEEWVDSVHDSRGAATSRAKGLAEAAQAVDGLAGEALAAEAEPQA